MSLQNPPPEGHYDFPLDFHWKTRPSFIVAAGVSLAGHPRALEARNSIMTSLALAGRAGRGGWVSYSRSKRYYAPLSRYEGTAFTYDRVLDAVEELGTLGLIEEQRALPSPTGTGWQSRMRATDRLTAAFEAAPIEHVGPRDVLELRDEQGERMAYLDTERTRRLRRAVQARNEALRAVRIEMPEGDGWIHTPGHVSARSEKGKKGWANVRPTPVPQVVRIYGRGRWDLHGRLYGWWQQLPEDRRAELLINGEAAYEADWSACHPTLLYAIAGKVPVGDVYKVEGFHRDHGKAALNRAINCRSLRGAVLSLMKDDERDPGSWPHDEAYTRRLVDAVADRNAAIRQYLGSDAGIRLMHVESEMCMEVLRRCERENIPVLPVHDGFVTQDLKGPQVTAIMAEVMDAKCVEINPCQPSRKAGFPPHMGRGRRGGGVGGRVAGLSREAKAKPVSPASPSVKVVAKAPRSPARPVAAANVTTPVPAPATPLTPSWDLRERELSMLRYQRRLAAYYAAEEGVRRGSLEWQERMEHADAIARSVCESEWESGLRAFPLSTVPDRLPPVQAKAGKASARARRSPRRAMIHAQGRRHRESLAAAGA